MKKLILLFLLTALLPMGVSAYDAYINGIYYNFSGDEAYVTYNKKNPNRNVSDYSGTVVIPENVTHRGQTYTVTGIGKDAFINCSDLTSVTIPESVTSIGNLAFAFCHGLTSITIPGSVTTLGDFAFQGCDNLSSFIIPNSVTYIGRNAFERCSGMKSITFPNGVPTIGDDAFSSCYGLEKVIVPDLAAWCSISFSLFEANPLCYAHHLYSDETTEITDLTIPDGVSIKQYAFCHCSGLTSVTIPESVTTIGGSAFNGCDGLTSVSISNNVTVIGGGAFAYCTNLPSVTIPESVITIGGGAFYDCTGLTSVVIPNSVKFIGDRAFYDCSGLTSLIIGSGVTSIANDAFYGCYFTTDFVNNSALISSNNWGATLCDEETSDGLLIKSDTVVRCRPWANAITIPNSVTNIGERAFYECAGLTSITIPNNITSIGNYAFMGCINLNSINIPCSVTSIGIYAFEDCRSLNSITIPEGITSISEGAFHNCMSLRSVTIPSSVTVINDIAFLDCNNLTEVYCFAEEVPNTSYEAFYVISTGFDDPPIAIESATLHVPAGSVEKYKATSPWSEFGNIRAIEEPHQPLSFLEGNPIWVYKYEHIPMPRVPDLKCWIDTGERVYTYYFLGGKKEIEGRSYTMMGEVRCDRDGKITLSRWLPVREENGIVYAITDSLPGVVETEDNYDARYNDDNPMPYLRQGNECVLYNFSTDIGETLYPQNEGSTVKSIDTYQLLDGTECRILKTQWTFYDLYEKLGLLNADPDFGIMDPFIGWPVSLNGHIYLNILNAYYQDNIMLYKAPDARDGLCVNDTCWTRDDAEAYARSYKADPRQEEVFSYIRQLQKALEVEPVTFTKDQMATIILPTAPDASKGKYYRLDRCEKVEGQAKGRIVFERELQPQAHVPYIIMPFEDFSIDPSTLDLAGLSPDTVSIEGISFIGSYRREEFNQQEDFYIDIIDTTPDCSPLLGEGQGVRLIIGALRAYLVVDKNALLPWNDPYNQGGTKGLDDKLEIVLHDDGTDGIKNKELRMKNDGEWYSLDGRKIINGKLPRGINIIRVSNGMTRKMIEK